MTGDASIVTANARLVRVPLDPPRGDAIQKFDALELPLVDITDRAGHRGTGFGYTIGTGGTAIHALLQGDLLPQLPGTDTRKIVQIVERLRKSIHALTPGCVASTALAAIDIALWDLAGHRANAPLYLLLGGAQDRVRLYNTHVGWLNRDLDEMVALSREAVEREGFTALKLKVGKTDPEEDRERVAKVREAVGRATTLMIDANQSWTVDQAIGRIKRLERYDLYWIEEPLEHGLTFGPDPATHTHCTLGGMLGNNSCGIHSLMLEPGSARTSDNTQELDVLTYDGLRMRVGPTPETSCESIIRGGGRRGEIYRALTAIARQVR